MLWMKHAQKDTLYGYWAYVHQHNFVPLGHQRHVLNKNFDSYWMTIRKRDLWYGLWAILSIEKYILTNKKD